VVHIKAKNKIQLLNKGFGLVLPVIVQKPGRKGELKIKKILHPLFGKPKFLSQRYLEQKTFH
jgi:hypothetical protein